MKFTGKKFSISYLLMNKEADILFAVLQLLTVEKTGFQVAKQLRSRGMQKFEDHEGPSLYCASQNGTQRVP